ncbi:MAG: glycosyltransferase family 2 protein [Nitrospinae bacterium]|nr:glycosyltransferase family 2 protein [Nitrospinota bacterium]
MALNLIALVSIFRYMRREASGGAEQPFSRFEPPVSVIVPAYNEAVSIAASVRSLLQLNYPEFEIIVVNDGSTDATLETLKREFSLAPLPDISRRRLDTKPARAVYHSTIHPELTVIDKDNGGKADALNAGINASRYPLFCGVDADSILQRDSLHKVVRPFLEDSSTVAAGGSVRAVNGCVVSGGFLVESGLPKNPLALFQVVEYLRAFLIGRLGWSQLNALMVISGAFGLFKKEPVIEAGGYNPATVGEDMELVVRLHRLMRAKGARYRIAFLPDPICWTEAPENAATLRNQRIRWQRGLAESLALNRGLLFSRRGGMVGWFAFPFMLAFELLGAPVEVMGYLFMGAGYLLDAVSPEAFFSFLFLAVGLGMLLSVNSLLVEEMSFRIYRKPSNIALLFLYCAAENFGYRQMNAWWRVVGFWRFMAGARGGWGEMKRKGLGD